MNLQKLKALLIGIVILSSQLVFIGQQPANAAPCVTASSSFTGDGTTGVNGVLYNFIEFKTVSTCEWTVPSTMNADILIVGGGGGAGFGSNGGGGGAGQVVTNNSSLTLNSGAVISVTIGGGGTGGWNLAAGSWNFGQDGSTSSFGSYASAIGGGGGGGNNGSKGKDGGSGGGGAGTAANSQTLAGGTGNTTANSGWTARGFTGGTGSGNRGAGGAGAGAVGMSSVSAVGTGGNGVTIFGKNIGGGGGGWTSSGSASAISFGGGSGNLPSYSVANSTSQCSPSCHGAANTGGGGGGGANGGSGYIAIRYLADSTAPTITGPASATGATSAISISENATAVHTFTANESVTWSKSGTDGSFFTISSGGALTITSRNFESPADSGGDNTYVVIVTATDAALNAKNQTVTVTITNVNEAPTISINGSGETHTITQAENIASVLTYTATDVDAGSSLSFSISGTDAADFAINSSSGVLTFAANPDFEAPADSDTNNTYVVVITVSDGAALTDTQTLTVTISNANESASVNAPTVSGNVNKGVSTTITVTLNAAGKVRFFVGGKRISNCLARSTTGSYPNFSATCSWRPPVTGSQNITARVKPTDSSFSATTSSTTSVRVIRRVNQR
jgi:hypothetical protein